ncbi:hypothetical protein BDB01DRAFT_271600 [Pilobolus umbonatus]|nr:hypothetical protein BDB01DRAFT_271600 [Pilobolus umbonatus]
MPKLGILSFSCGDGSVRTVVVPHPKVVRKSMADVDESTTVFLKIKSARCVFSLGKSFVLGWGGHETLAVGCVDGTLALWNMVHALRTNQALDVQDTKKCMKIAIEIFRSSIVLLEWERETNRYLVLGGVDGDCRIVDIQDPFLHTRLTKNRTIKPVGAWSSNNFAFVTTESESHLKIYSFAENNVPSGSFIGESIGECNMIASSIFHPHIAYCSSIGWVMHVNTSPTKDRKWGTIMNVAYKLDYDEENDKYTYIDGVNHMTVDQAKELSGLEDFLSSSRSIQRITWCPTVRSAAFLASGGAAGLCRIEFVGCGTQWT